MGIRDDFPQLIKDYGSCTIDRKRLRLLQNKYDQLQAEIKDLKQQLDEVNKENDALKKQLRAMGSPS